MPKYGKILNKYIWNSTMLKLKFSWILKRRCGSKFDHIITMVTYIIPGYHGYRIPGLVG